MDAWWENFKIALQQPAPFWLVIVTVLFLLPGNSGLNRNDVRRIIAEELKKPEWLRWPGGK